MSADAWLDPDRELLHVQQYVELCAAAARQSCHLAEKLKQHVLKSNQMNEQPAESPMRLDVSPCQLSDDMPLAIESGADGESLCTHVEKDINLACIVPTISHFGQLSTLWYIHRYYWWPAMGTDIELFCSSCTSFQVTKDSTQ